MIIDLVASVCLFALSQLNRLTYELDFGTLDRLGMEVKVIGQRSCSSAKNRVVRSLVVVICIALRSRSRSRSGQGQSLIPRSSFEQRMTIPSPRIGQVVQMYVIS